MKVLKQQQLEKLVKFCNKLRILDNEETRGLCCYFSYKNKQYYASIIFDVHTGVECAIFPTFDDVVTSWDPLYLNNNISFDSKHFRECIFEFLSNL